MVLSFTHERIRTIFYKYPPNLEEKNAINEDDPMIMRVMLPFQGKRRVTQEQHGRISICKGAGLAVAGCS